jgi:osmotically-inducible protein OsmY
VWEFVRGTEENTGDPPRGGVTIGRRDAGTQHALRWGMIPTLAMNAAAAPDRVLQERVLDALDFDPLEPASIGVAVCHGVVTLYGRVDSREEKWLAERVCSELAGVRAVANDLEVTLDPAIVNDSTLAEAAVDELSWRDVGEPGSIKVTVSDRWITLSGIVADFHERGTAERIVRRLRGVRGVSNALGVLRAESIGPVRLG